MPGYCGYFSSRFLSTPSARRATSPAGCPRPPEQHFYPRPPRGGRPPPKCRTCCCRRFLSTPSARRATAKICMRFSLPTNFYPRPPRGGRPQVDTMCPVMVGFLSTPSARRATGVRRSGKLTGKEFLSTPSARRATSLICPPSCARHDFYPRPPRGGRPLNLSEYVDESWQFLSTPSARRATRPGRCFPADYGISIHALREEGDAPHQKSTGA